MTDLLTDGRKLADVPRPPRGRDPAAVAAAATARTSRPAAWWGMLILIATEATLFGTFVGTYYYLRFRAPVWPPPGTPKPELVTPIVLAAVLALSVWPVLAASAAVARGALARTRLLLAVALVVQCAWLAYALHDFGRQLDELEVSRNAYSSIYYVLLGAEHAHVALGILFVVWLLWKLARGLTLYRLNAVQAVAVYWIFVAVVTVVVTAVLVSARA
jgi:heme/copper-type cytochrome/quinol oxidase subunit 3